MTGSLRSDRGLLALAVALGFVAALAGTWVGRQWLAPPPTDGANDIHAFVHQRLDLDPAQTTRIEAIEADFAIRRRALEAELRADNARLAAAIEAEHGYGPKVAEAVDASHHAMGALQKASLEHVFAMRGVLRPDQAARFDAAVVRALTPAAP
ncbi:periplasmic heavy metal sensor [Novosphingobium sp. FSY-8]|uniref:Periplasmic heavy metal sensor n=1 Tax=Novosphingobium ovatum TaxID=1908523 RepID=A0ABW9XD20_9SPHN|nr:periplasmic heavy metal sensor [Novosphingobium ovatum]NBC36425.1 periplasmic heavy metal sensor [Novosphingobium ovatum]